MYLKLIKRAILYLLPLAIAALLLQYTYRDISWQELSVQLQQVRMGWIILALAVGLIGHLIRAYRWTILLQPIGFRIGFLQSFQALLAGYLSTLFIPRVGELVRCSLLNRTTGTPLGVLLGTSALERLLGGAGFLLIALLTLLFSFPKIAATFQMISFPAIGATKLVVGIGGLVVVVAIVGYIIYTKHTKGHTDGKKLLDRVGPFIDNLKKGFMSIRLSPSKQGIALLALLEWGIYYVEDYISTFALQGVSEPFSWTIGLTILTMSTISFALPVQGGLGAYHLLVSSALMAYGVPASSALLYAGVMHSTHFLGLVFFGLVFTLVAYLFKRRSM